MNQMSACEANEKTELIIANFDAIMMQDYLFIE